MKGMSGGLVIVRGHAGDRVGDRMRRGTIIVEGNVGGYAAATTLPPPSKSPQSAAPSS